MYRSCEMRDSEEASASGFFGSLGSLLRGCTAKKDASRSEMRAEGEGGRRRAKVGTRERKMSRGRSIPYTDPAVVESEAHKSASYNVCTEENISRNQVERLYARSKAKSGF